MLVNTDASGNIVFPDTDVTSDVSNSIEIPASFIQHRSGFTGEHYHHIMCKLFSYVHTYICMCNDLHIILSK